MVSSRDDSDPAIDEPDPDDPDPADQDPAWDDDATPTMPCPYCKKQIVEDAEICHHCGQWVREENAPSNTPMWIVIATSVLLLAGLLTCALTGAAH